MKTRNQFKIIRLMSALRWCNSSRQFCAIMFIGLLVSLITTSVVLSPSRALALGEGDGRHPFIRIMVTNLDTELPIQRNTTLYEVGIPWRVTVTNYGADCAGQFVITAIGAPGYPPSVSLQALAFTLGPSVGNYSVVSDIFLSGVTPDGLNDFKISASCNGALPQQKSFDFFEFFVERLE